MVIAIVGARRRNPCGKKLRKKGTECATRLTTSFGSFGERATTWESLDEVKGAKRVEGDPGATITVDVVKGDALLSVREGLTAKGGRDQRWKTDPRIGAELTESRERDVVVVDDRRASLGSEVVEVDRRSEDVGGVRSAVGSGISRPLVPDTILGECRDSGATILTHATA